MASVRIGRIGRAHGLRGETTIVDCDLTPDELQALGTVGWRNRQGEERTLVIEAVRPMQGRLLVCFRGVGSRESARELSLGDLSTDASRLPDPGPGMAYSFQLVGLAVETEDGRGLGTLESVLLTGANPVYVVQGEREWLIPATAEVVRRVDLESRRIVVALPAGLEDL